jgi:hypothetical protein
MSSTVAYYVVELGFGDFELVRGEATWSTGDRWALCSPNVVDHVVTNFSLTSSGATKVWILGKESVDRCTDTDDFDAGDPIIGGLGRCRQRCDAVQETVVSTVY